MAKHRQIVVVDETGKSLYRDSAQGVGDYRRSWSRGPLGTVLAAERARNRRRGFWSK